MPSVKTQEALIRFGLSEPRIFPRQFSDRAVVAASARARFLSPPAPLSLNAGTVLLPCPLYVPALTPSALSRAGLRLSQLSHFRGPARLKFEV